MRPSTPCVGAVLATLLMVTCGGAWAACQGWKPVAGPAGVGSVTAVDAVAPRRLNSSLDAVLHDAKEADCPASGTTVMRTAVVRLRSAVGAGAARGRRGRPLLVGAPAPRGRRVCRLRVALLTLRLPCGQGALRVGNELMCGGHLGARTMNLPADTRAVPVHYSSVSPDADFEAVLRLEACDDADAQSAPGEGGRAVSDADCGGLFPVSLGKAVGLVSPGYPTHYPHHKNCLFVLQQRDDAAPACFLDLDLVDFNLAPSSAGCGAGDRFLVEGVVGAAGGVGLALCGVRSGVMRLPLLEPAQQQQQQQQHPTVRLRFLSDGATTAPGFRVLATLSPCRPGDQDRKEPLLPDDTARGNDTSSGKSLAGLGSFASASLGFPFPAFPAYPAQLPQCCGRVHAGAQLFLTSPGFPSGLASGWSSDCVFPVARLLPQTCRLRLVLHQFLLLGTCDKHYLEVDGRRLCGCQSGAQILSYFRPDEVTKLLRYSRHLLSTGAFIIEVRQEACAPVLPPIGAVGPGLPGLPGLPGIPGLPWRARSTDASNGPISSPWSNSTSASKRGDLVRFPDQAESTGSKDTPQDAPQDVPEAAGQEQDQPAQRGVLSAALGLFPVCGSPTYKDWLAGAAAWAGTVPTALVQCPVGIFPFAKCREMRGLTGGFASPRYPGPYPNNVRACYRFDRYPEQCSLEVTFLDFDLEPSPTCNKDYVSLGGATRYCGSTLASALLVISFQDSQYIDILFISDNAITARGFRATFRQVPCTPVAGPVPGAPGVFSGGGVPAAVPGLFPAGGPLGPGPFGFDPAIAGIAGRDVLGLSPSGGGAPAAGAFPGGPPIFPRPRPLPVEQADVGPYQASGQPERPPLHPEPTTYPPPRTPPPPASVCGGDVRQQHFALDLADVAGHPECEFTVRRVSEDICGLQILVERMALDCRREHVVVGGRTLCGADLEGQSVTVDFLGDAVRMVYQSFAEGAAAAPQTQGDFLIHVQQVADCLDLDVTPVARFGKAAPDDVSECVVVLDAVRGRLEAPALHPRPPHDLSCSYVFRRRPGHCVLRLDFLDFAIASGPVCTTSYFALRNHKYCATDLARTSHGLSFGAGRSDGRGRFHPLHPATATIELPYRLHKDVAAARWNISYAQLPC